MSEGGQPLQRRTFRRRCAENAAPVMFWISVIFLADTAALIVLWVDVPRVEQRAVAEPAALLAISTEPIVAEPIVAEPDVAEPRLSAQLGIAALVFAILLWPVFIVELLIYWFSAESAPRLTRAGLLACICPPLRLGTPNIEMDGKVWLPRIGWTHPSEEIRERLERIFGLPMVVIALTILPVLLVEFGMKEQVSAKPWLRLLLHVSTGTIWFAFALEFTVMVSVTKKKLKYCQQHWLDLAIILLPLISFLRSLRAIRATRLAQLAKVQQLSKMSRIYRLRGLLMKGFRAILLLEVLNRLLRITPEKQIRTLKEQLADKQRDIRSLKKRIANLEALVATRQITRPTELPKPEAVTDSE